MAGGGRGQGQRADHTGGGSGITTNRAGQAEEGVAAQGTMEGRGGGNIADHIGQAEGPVAAHWTMEGRRRVQGHARGQ